MESEIMKTILDQGMGAGSFLVLIYALYKAGQMFQKFLENDLTHLGDTLNQVSVKLDKIIDLLEDGKGPDS